MDVPAPTFIVPHAGRARNPYVGLRPYTKDERELFFGRGRAAELLINKIFASPLTLLYAPSGVGKTSLLRTLVVPNLSEPHTYDAHVIYFEAWAEAEPREVLLAALSMSASLTASTGSEKEGLVARARSVTSQSSRTMVLILDQFEEFLQRHAKRPDPLRSEVAGLVRAGLNVHICLSFREEFLAAVDACFREHVPTIFSSTYHLEHLTDEAANTAITEPAEKFGRRYQTDLVAKLLQDLQAEPESAGYSFLAMHARGIDLPFLQIVCGRLWSEAESTGKTEITREMYETLGFRTGIVTKYVRAVMSGFSPQQYEDVARILSLLAPQSGMKMGYPLAVLSQQTQLTPVRVQSLLKPLAENSIVRTRATRAGPIYELYHDGFIKVLRPWVDKILEQLRGRKSRNRMLMAASAIVAAALAAVGLILVTATYQQGVATSERFAALAKVYSETDAELGLLLGVEAVHFLMGAERLWKPSRAEADDALRLALSKSQVRRVFKGHGKVTAAAFSPKGDLLATVGADGALRLWKVQTGEKVSVLDKHKGDTGDLLSIAFSSSGRFLVGAISDGTARIWDTVTGRVQHDLKGHSDFLTSAALSSDGKRVLTASYAHGVQLWDTASGKALHTFKADDNYVAGVAFSPDGSRIATAGGGGIVSLWDLNSKQERKLKGHQGAVQSVAFSGDGRRLVTAGEDGTPRVWDVDTGLLAVTLVGHKRPVSSAAFSPGPDSNYIVTAGADRTARVWQAEKGIELAAFSHHSDSVSSAIFSQDGKQIVTASDDGTWRLWEFGNIAAILSRMGPPNQPIAIALGADALLEIDPKTKSVSIVHRREKPVELPVEAENALGIAFAPDKQLVATGGADTVARVWKADTGKSVAKLEGHTGAIRSLAFSSDGARLVSASDDATAIVWSWNGKGFKRSRQLEGHSKPVTCAALSKDGKRIVTASDDATARVWSTDDWSYTVLRGHRSKLTSAAFSPDGNQLVTASVDGTARIWDAQSGAVVSKLPPGLPLTGAQFVVGQRGLLVETYSGTLVNAWSEKLSSSSGTLLLSPDGRLESVSEDDKKGAYACEIWCRPRTEVLALAEQRKTRFLTAAECDEHLGEARPKGFARLLRWIGTVASSCIEETTSTGESAQVKGLGE